MRLHPEVVDFMAKTAELDLPVMGESSPEELRAGIRKRRLIIRPAVETVGKIATREIPGPGGNIPVRIYHPEGGDEPHPIVMVFHGGGWVIGDPDTEDTTSRGLCRRLDAVVVSVDYRLAPETPFPGAAEDCYAATKWAAENADELGGDADLIATSGTSAGGNLAAVVAMMARDRGGPMISHQALYCPVIDFGPERASYNEFADGFGLTKAGMLWFWDQYVPDKKELDNPYVCPIRADSLAGLPDATVIVAECDVLRDEAEEYARAMADAGVDSRLTRYEGMIHGFNVQLGLIQAAEAALDETADRVAKSFSRARS